MSDKGGFNNIRMAMETVVAMAIFMGRTIVLPPQQGMYLLGRVSPRRTNCIVSNLTWRLNMIA
jgi:hypothetical protein